MKAEFFKDENGNIWFYYASNIQMRPSKNRLLPAYELRSGVGGNKILENQKDSLIKDIEEYEKTNGQ